MSIEDIRITNQELASAMARGAVKQTELEMANIDRKVREMQVRPFVRSSKERRWGGWPPPPQVQRGSIIVRRR